MPVGMTRNHGWRARPQLVASFGIAAAALGGPEVGVVAYGVLLAGMLIERAMWSRSRG